MSSNLHLKKCKIHKLQNLSYRLSVSADMEKFLSVIYRYRPIRKFILSVVIGIGRYGKKHIDHTLNAMNAIMQSKQHKILVFYFPTYCMTYLVDIYHVMNIK